jgi:hypothetical protein
MLIKHLKKAMEQFDDDQEIGVMFWSDLLGKEETEVYFIDTVESIPVVFMDEEEEEIEEEHIMMLVIKERDED